MKRYLEYLAKSKTPQSGYIKENTSNLDNEWIYSITIEKSTILAQGCIERGIDINKKFINSSQYPLEYVTMVHDVKMIKFLLEQPNINVNIQNNRGETPLLIASGNNRIDVVRLLLKHPNIDVNLTDKDGKNFIDWLQNRDFLNSYELQNTIIKNNQKNIIIFDKYRLVHPKIKEKYSNLFKASNWGLL